MSAEGPMGPSRRRVLVGTAWLTPVILVGVTAPRAAASPGTPADSSGSGVTGSGNEWAVDVVLTANEDISAIWAVVVLDLDSANQFDPPAGGNGWTLTYNNVSGPPDSIAEVRYDYPAGLAEGATLNSEGLFTFTHEVIDVEVWGTTESGDEVLWSYP